MSYSELNNFSLPISWHPSGAIEMHWDDGTEYDYINTYPILKARGLKCAFNVVTSIVGDANRVTWANCVEIDADGFFICNHTRDHVVPFDGLSQAEKEADLDGGRDDLVAHGLTRGALYVCYPGSAQGSNVDTAAAMTAQGMRTGLESGFDANIPKTTPPFELDYGNWSSEGDGLGGYNSLYASMNRVAAAAWAGKVAGWGGHGVVGAGITYLNVFLDWVKLMGVPVITIDDYYQREIV